MIFLFRKEIKKWNKVWWLVIASLGLGSASFFFMKSPDKTRGMIAKVDGEVVPVKKFQQAFAETKSMYDNLARYWGIPFERLAKMMGIENVAQHSLDKCIREVLLDKVVDDFTIILDDKSFQESLAGTVSKAFIGRDGQVNIKAYHNYLSRMRMSIAEYEAAKDNEFRRNVLMRALEQGAYVPGYVVDAALQEKGAKKSFAVLKLPFSAFVERAKKTEVAADVLKKFYNEKQEVYRVAEKRKADYWVLTPEEYKNKVDVSDEVVERFYERNKTTLYRIPPKVKVRTLVLNVAPNASPDVVARARKKAEGLLKQAQEKPGNFEALVKEHSQDKETAEKGGLIDFFSRGTYDPEFEKVAFLTLKQPGDISEIVQTKKGLEIIKLEERIAASEKPLATVREDVVKTIRNRKALMVLRGDAQAVIRTARTDMSIFDKFAASNKLKTNKTDWLTKAEGKGYELLDALAQKLFADFKRKNVFGYFVHQGKHIIFRMTDKQESFISPFDKVAEQVKMDWYNQEAEKLQTAELKRLRREIASKKLDLKAVAEKENLGLVVTSLIDRQGEIEGLKEAGNIVGEAFNLTDPVQLLEYSHQNDHFLIKLVKVEREDKPVGAIERDQASMSEKMSSKKRYLDGFIASLQRSARIEIRQEILKAFAQRG